jgi:hypothetical protein
MPNESLTQTKKLMDTNIFKEMAARWPSPVIARAEVDKFTGGGIKPKTLANADSKGIGPKGRFLVGRRVCYPVSNLLEWLRQNVKEIDHATIH